jgi:hypothetical protein
MPWVLSDFTSPQLHLDNPSIYRDLANSRSLENDCRFYLQSFSAFAEAGPILSGRGAFTSISAAFANTALELIPEFFSFPDFLAPSMLPPWAARPLDFVYRHRQALESPHVTASLHTWLSIAFASLGPHARRSESGPRPRLQFRTSLPQAPRVVAFSRYAVWFLDKGDYVQCTDVRGGLRSLDGDPPPPRAGNAIHIASGSRGVFCYVPETTRTLVRIFLKDRDPYTIESRVPVTRLHCEETLLAWVDADSVLFARSPPPDNIHFSARLACPGVTALCAAPAFQAVICGSRDERLHIWSLKSGARLRVVQLRAKPLAVIVTPAWGFIVTCVKEIGRNGKQAALVVTTLNGEEIARQKIKARIGVWAAWTSLAGFDYLVFCDQENCLYAFEAYEPGSIAFVREVQGVVIGLHFLPVEGVIVIAYEGGRLEFVPWSGHANMR